MFWHIVPGTSNAGHRLRRTENDAASQRGAFTKSTKLGVDWARLRRANSQSRLKEKVIEQKTRSASDCGVRRSCPRPWRTFLTCDLPKWCSKGSYANFRTPQILTAFELRTNKIHGFTDSLSPDSTGTLNGKCKNMFSYGRPR